MKKVALILISGFAAVSMFAQSTVNFGNIGAGLAISNIDTKAAVPSGTAYMAALYYLPDGAEPTTVDFDQTTPVGAMVTRFSVAGAFAGGTRTFAQAGLQLGWFQVRAWEVAFGSTYEAAKNAPARDVAGTVRQAYIGTSIITRIKGGDAGAGVPPTALTGGTPQFRGFYVAIVPEPTVIGLGLLGIGSLLLLRRRK